MLMPKLRVVAWNIEEGQLDRSYDQIKCLTSLVDCIFTHNPDIVLLNEVCVWNAVTYGGVDQIAWIAQRAHYNFTQRVTTATLFGRGSKCAAVLSRIPLLSGTRIEHSAHPDGSGYATLHATAMFNGLTHHLFSTRFNAYDVAENQRSHNTIRDLIATIPWREPVIIGGDFNTGAGGDEHWPGGNPRTVDYGDFSTRTGLRSVLGGVAWTEAVHEPDHLLVRGPYAVISAERVMPPTAAPSPPPTPPDRPYPSDHPWVIADLVAMRPQTLVSHADGRLHAVMAELDNQVWHNEQASPGPGAVWTGWHPLSQPGNKALALGLAAHPDGRAHAVMAGLDNQVWHNEQTAAGPGAAWSGWHALSQTGDRAKVLALAAHPDGRMHAVMAGLDDQVLHNEQTATGPNAAWTGWHMLSQAGDRAVALALAVHPDGRMHAVMAGLDNQVWHNEQTAVGKSAAWSGWHALSHAGDKATALALAAHRDGRMHAAMIGLDGQLWHNEQTVASVNAAWSGWHVLSQPGNKAISLALATHADDHAHAVMAGLDNQVWHNEQLAMGPGGAWSGWFALSQQGDLGTGVALAARPDGRLAAVLVGTDDQIWRNEQTAAVGGAWTGWSPLP